MICHVFSVWIILFLAVTLAIPVPAQEARAASAAEGLNLPALGTRVNPSRAFHPPVMAGMTIHPDNPLKFDFIITTGEEDLQGDAFKAEAQKLIHYFFATLTVPDEEMWVNLSPYEKDRIIADGLGQTEMGRDMLIQDYLLKQFTASLMYPEEALGDQFWQRVYEKTQARFGTTAIPTNTFNKVWIVPEEAVVYVNGSSVFVSQSHLNVMLEEDYLALESNQETTRHGLGQLTQEDIESVSDEAKEVVRDVLLPEIEKEVNEGKNFANLRQIYHSMILATWYKKNLRQSIWRQAYVDQNKVTGIDLEDKQVKEKIYQQYIQAFQQGVFNYIKEDYDAASQKIILRKYFSGGIRPASVREQKEGEPGIVSSALASARGVRRVEVTAPFINGDREIVSAPMASASKDPAAVSGGVLW